METASDPVQGVLDREPPIPPRTKRIFGARRVGSSGGPIQSRIGQSETFGDHRLLGLGSGQLRDRIHLIQRKRPFGEPLPQQGQILETTSHPNQLGGSGMTKTEPSRNPLGKVASPICEELLAEVSVDQPVTDLGAENGQTREQMRQHPIHLIIGETLPLHVPNIRRGCDKFGPETSQSEKKSEKHSLGPSRYRPFQSGSRFSRKAASPSAASSVPSATDCASPSQERASARPI